jgi:hypothetical protein
VAQLRKVTLWLSPPYPNVSPTAEYHPAKAWLIQHGRNPAMVKSVEFTNVFIFEEEARRMPMLVLHEFSHAYHHQVLGYEHAGLMAAYARDCKQALRLRGALEWARAAKHVRSCLCHEQRSGVLRGELGGALRPQ